MMTIFGCGDCAKAELSNAHPTNNKGKMTSSRAAWKFWGERGKFLL